MSNVYDRAHDLARALTGCDEYRQWEAARKKIEADQTSFKLLQDFRMKQLELQRSQMLGQNTAEQIKQLEHLMHVLSQNPVISRFLQIEQRFSRMMMDVQKIIGEAVGLNPEG